MIIDYDDNSPVIPTDPDTGDIDWLGVKQLAMRQHDWYARGASVMPVNQRLVNMWYIYCWMKYSGYAPIAMRALASIMWFECGFDGSQWGTGRVRSDTAYEDIIDNPIYEEGHESDPDYIIGYYGLTKIVASNWATLPDSWPINLSIPIASQLTNPVIMTYPSYGLVQWTPYGILWAHSDLYGDSLGEDWSRLWLNNSTLQCFTLDWEESIADATPTGQQTGATYYGEWINDRHAGEADIVECTWQEWKDDSYLSEVTGPDDDLFLNSCHQFIVHYIHGTPAQATNADTERLTVLHQYIDNAFTIWDNNGGGGLLDLPEPPGTIGDPWHLTFYAILGKWRKRQNVRTILF